MTTEQNPAPMSWDLHSHGLGHVPGTFHVAQDGTPRADVFLPLEPHTDLHGAWSLKSLHGSGAHNDVFIRSLRLIDNSLDTGHHRVLRLKGEIALETPADHSEFTDALAQDFTFDSIEVGLRGLGEWLGLERGWVDAAETFPAPPRPKWVDQQWGTVEIDGAQLTGRIAQSWKGYPGRDWELRGYPRLRIDLPVREHLADIEPRWLAPIRTAVTLAWLVDSPYTELRLSRRDWRPASTAHDRLWARVISPLVQGGTDFHEGFLAPEERVDAMKLRSTISTARAQSYPAEQLIQAHSQDVSLVARFMHSMSSVEGFAGGGSNKPLSARLTRLASTAQVPMRNLLGSNGWADDLATMRNTVLHGRVPHSMSSEDLHALRGATRVARLLALIAWRHSLGLPTDSAQSELTNAASGWPRVHRLAQGWKSLR